MGEAIRQAVGDKKGICRFGECILPMDETLVLCALDLSGRPYLRYHLELTVPSVGQFDTEMVHEFFLCSKLCSRNESSCKTARWGEQSSHY